MNNMPLLPGSNMEGRQPEQVSQDDLKTVGISGSAFAIHTGDVIKFPEGQPLVVKQKIRNEENSPIAYYVGVERNGKASWLGIGNLTRRDVDGKPLGKFQEKMLRYPSFAAMYEDLAGKTIKGGTLREQFFAVFDNGKRTNEKVGRMIADIECDWL